ncbi:hypothetical protein P8605_03240 [Streptomyces sp. T-3]|nr:hypothetical protein [Streptomyces sp. T-3]
MGFKVTAADLEGYADQVGRAAEHMEHAKLYVQGKYGSCLEPAGAADVGISDQGVLAIVMRGHASAVADVEALVTRVETLLRSANRELALSARYYAETDEASVTAMDSTLPPSRR